MEEGPSGPPMEEDLSEEGPPMPEGPPEGPPMEEGPSQGPPPSRPRGPPGGLA